MRHNHRDRFAVELVRTPNTAASMTFDGWPARPDALGRDLFYHLGFDEFLTWLRCSGHRPPIGTRDHRYATNRRQKFAAVIGHSRYPRTTVVPAAISDGAWAGQRQPVGPDDPDLRLSTGRPEWLTRDGSFGLVDTTPVLAVT